MKKPTLFFCLTIFQIFSLIGQNGDTILVDINLDLMHSVGEISEFDRQKYIVLHGSLQEQDWNNEPDKMNYFFGDLDAYLGRDNGGINWWLTQSPEDPNRPGYANPAFLSSTGANRRSTWANDSRNVFDHKSDVMIGGQTSVIWPGHKDGWELAGADAIGEYMAQYINDFYRDISDPSAMNGHPAPRYLEVLNEPEYELFDDPNIPAGEEVELIDIFRFHRDVAKSFKEHNNTTQIGGYTVAFPFYDVDNFQRWEDRMKLFVDTAGTDMDFYSLHFYDFNKHWQTGNIGHRHFKGSRMEATMDMLEQYNMLKFDEIKPLVISEYGGRDHSIEDQSWTPQRDWVFLKAVSPLMMQFMERPNNIVKTVPFIMSKAAWSPSPHNWRLMRQAQEPEIYQQNNLATPYVFTEMIKFFELWSDVNGTRIDAMSHHPDVLSQAYVDGDKVYLLLSNLTFDQQVVDLEFLGQNGNTLENVKVKHLHEVNSLPVLDVNEFESLENFTIDSEATVIIEYDFSSDMVIDQTAAEVKHYATTYYQPIIGDQPINFEINNVGTDEYGEAVLRLGFGRTHNHSKMPTVFFNGVELNVPMEIAGESQEFRDVFFGMLKIPVPYDIIQQSNTISVTFPDDGGHISAVTMQTIGFSREVVRRNVVQAISLYPNSIEMGIGQERQLTETITPVNAADLRVIWTSSDESIVTVDENGKITGLAIGAAVITVTSVDGGHQAICNVTVFNDNVPVLVDTLIVTPNVAELLIAETIQLSYEILPIDADDQSITWSSENDGIATVDNSGLVTAQSEGMVNISVTSSNGKSGTCAVTATPEISGFTRFDDRNQYLSTVYMVGDNMEVSCNFKTTTGRTVGENGIKFWLREIEPGWSVAADYTATDFSVVGQSEGTASAVISLENVIPSTELPEGNFYFLWISFTHEDNTLINNSENVFPIQILGTTATHELAASKVAVFPNPAKDILYLESDFEFSTATIYSVTGQSKMAAPVNGNTINIAQLQEGFFILELKGNEYYVTKKILIQR